MPSSKVSGGEENCGRPANAASGSGPPVRAPEGVPGAPWKGRLLVVDDEEVLLRLMGQTLRRLGLTVDECANAGQARAAFSPAPERYAAAVVDLTLPDADGLELARELLGGNPVMRLIVVSGYPFDPGTLGGEPGQVQFLQKPFLPRTLAEAAARAASR